MATRPAIVGLEMENSSRSVLFSSSRGRILIGALIFLGLLSLSLIIAVIVQARQNSKNSNSNANTNNNNNNELCITSGCLSSASYQLSSMDLTASSGLCTDFYKYACGGWQQTHPIQSHDVERTILGDIIDRRDAEIQRLLDSAIIRSTPKSWEYKIKTYYKECRDDYARVVDSGKYMIALINDINTIDGWFLFDNNAPDANQTVLLKNQTLYQQMSHIHGDLGVRAVFGLRTRFDEMDPSIKRLEFFPDGLTMEVNDYLRNDAISEARRAALQIYIISVTKALAQEAGIADGNLEDRTFTIANDVFTVELFLASSRRDNPNPSKPSLITLKNMSDEFSFDFVSLMTHELGEAGFITELTTVYLNNIMYFTDAFEYVGNIDDPLFARMVHNYLRWHLVRTYIEDLSYTYVHLHRQFLDAYYGYALHSSNEAYCVRETVRRFPLAVQRLYTMNSTRFTNAIPTIEMIVDLLKNSLKSYINERAKWMPDEETKQLAQDKIDKFTAAIGYTPIAADDSLLDDYYDTFSIGEESHFQNSYGYHRFRRWSLSTSLVNPNILEHWDLFETRTNRLFDYIALFNRLFVIASGMHEPLVSFDWPWPVNMGSIGVLLAQRMFESIDMPEGRMHLSNGTQSDWWSSPTIIGYNTSRNCITDYYKNEVKTLNYNVNGISIQVQLAGEPFSPTTLRHIGALRFAYAAMKTIDSIKNFKMPGTNLTSDQTFFLSYAQTQCYQRQDLTQLLRTQLGAYDERTALNAALIQMPEFAQAFQCQLRDNLCFN